MKSKKILTIGLAPCFQRTLYMAGFAPGEVNRVRQVHTSIGGKAVNVARVLVQQGTAAHTTGFAGDADAAQLKARLREEGVSADFILYGGMTRWAQTIVEDGRPATEIVEEAPAVPFKVQERLYQHLERLTAESSLVSLSGTLPPGFDADTYARILKSCGPGVWVDTSGPALLGCLPHRPHLLKMNESELVKTCDLCSGLSIPQVCAAAGNLSRDSGAWVLVTRGSAEAVLVRETDRWAVSPPSLTPVNTIGCGDAMLAGMLHATGKGRDMLSCAAYGAACAAANAITSVAGVIQPRRVAAFERQVTVRKL